MKQKELGIKTLSFHISTKGHAEMIDITEDVQKELSSTEFNEGQVLVFVSGSTAGLTTIEFEPGLKKDFPALFEKIAPQDLHYHHEDTWHDGNGHSHVRASLLGPSLTIPFVRGKLKLGTWQQIILMDFDNGPRDRDITVQVTGV